MGWSMSWLCDGLCNSVSLSSFKLPTENLPRGEDGGKEITTEAHTPPFGATALVTMV